MKVQQIALLCLCSVMPQVCFSSVTTESNVVPESKQQSIKEPLNTEVTISDEYQQELEAFKKLQMDNIRLKLQAENQKLSQQSGINAGDVKLVYIYSTSTKGRVAEVLGGGLGLREVRVGDHLYDGYTVQEIGKDYIRSVSNDGKENLLKFLFLGQE
ncbi:TPA: hypothetical protein J1246_004331 [Escherichia coli]|nr:hypothetical protein [Escherichia coli]HBA8924934.1 hypothetical protein [Escherichia coli]